MAYYAEPTNLATEPGAVQGPVLKEVLLKESEILANALAYATNILDTLVSEGENPRAEPRPIKNMMDAAMENCDRAVSIAQALQRISDVLGTKRT